MDMVKTGFKCTIFREWVVYIMGFYIKIDGFLLSLGVSEEKRLLF